MQERPTRDSGETRPPAYEPPVAEDLDTNEQPSVTAAGNTQVPA